MKILSGTSNLKLSKNIAKNLKLKLINTNIRRFADGEIYIEINENIRGNSVFVIQSTSNPANDNLMELLLCIDALRRSSAKNITAVIPYYGYARQDRKVVPRTSISAKVVANLITNAGASRVVTVDLHAGQIQGFFEKPVDHLYASSIFVPFLKSLNIDNLTIASPDMGGSKRAYAYSKFLDSDVVICYKQRSKGNIITHMELIGDVTGKNVVLIDDMVDTAGTLTKAADLMIEKGAESVIAICTHALLSGDAYEKIEKSKLNKLITSDSIEIKKESSKVEHLSCSKIFAEAMYNVHHNKSIDKLFINK